MKVGIFPAINVESTEAITAFMVSMAVTFNTINKDHKNVMVGSTSPGHLLSRFERNIWSSVPPTINTKKNTIKTVVALAISLCLLCLAVLRNQNLRRVEVQLVIHRQTLHQ